MRKIELGWRKVIRSWTKYCKMLAQRRTKRIAIDKFEYEWDNIKISIDRHYRARSLTDREVKRLYAYAKTQRDSI